MEYATKRYRSNLINWGIIPFIVGEQEKNAFAVGDQLFIPGIRKAVATGAESTEAILYRGSEKRNITLLLANLTSSEREILLAGCLINYYAQSKNE